MATAIGRAGEIDPDLCRETAFRRFGKERMIAAYLDLYAGLTSRRTRLNGAA
jgi:hypothetical protein